jgi:hypothetical protein
MAGWIDLAQDKDKWRVLVNDVIKFCFHKMREISSSAKEVTTPIHGVGWLVS